MRSIASPTEYEKSGKWVRKRVWARTIEGGFPTYVWVREDVLVNDENWNQAAQPYEANKGNKALHSIDLADNAGISSSHQ